MRWGVRDNTQGTHWFIDMRHMGGGRKGETAGNTPDSFCPERAETDWREREMGVGAEMHVHQRV